MALLDAIFSGSGGITASVIDLIGVDAIYRTTIRTIDKNTDEEVITIIDKTVKVSPPIRYSVYERKDSSIKEEDCKILAKGYDYTNILRGVDKIIIKGVSYVIIFNEPIYSGDEIAMYKMQVRAQNDN
jgi:hypothetical protein